MSFSSPTSLLDVDLHPGRPPILHAGNVIDASTWADEHRIALRAVVAEHGSVLVRGLGLHDVAGTGAVFQRLGTTVMGGQGGFASRPAFPGGVFPPTKGPPNQPMCMHHELSYRVEFPGLMLFACLTA